MSITAYAVLAVLSLLCMMAAQRLAAVQGRRTMPWMVAALAFGPFPLIPLALLHKRVG